MAEFLLIHGSCHGAWCWRDVIPGLQARGHRARAIDLPGHGADRTPAAGITLGAYVEAVLAAIDGPVHLVGHSLAGITLTAVAEAAPETIARLVYLCAWLPEPGLSAAQMRAGQARQPLIGAIRWTPDRSATYFDDDRIEAIFYPDCPPGTLDYARANLSTEPSLPSNTPVTYGARFAGVPKSYIRCRRDGAIPYEAQVAMTEGWPGGTVYDMDCGHSPFFADPSRLAEILSEIAR
jgi:pimeloyl-ACP methyl ester carboxylesterase